MPRLLKVAALLVLLVVAGLLILGVITSERGSREATTSIQKTADGHMTEILTETIHEMVLAAARPFSLSTSDDFPVIAKGEEAELRILVEGEQKGGVSLGYVVEGEGLEVSLSKAEVVPPSDVVVRVRAGVESQPGLYRLYVYGISGDGYTDAVSLTISVLERPSYAIRILNKLPEVFETGNNYNMELEVVPIGGFSEEVSLSLRAEGPIKYSLSNPSGIPPFRTTLAITIERVYVDKNMQGVLVLGGNPRGGTLTFLFGNEEVETSGSWLAGLLYVFTAPIRVMLGLMMGMGLMGGWIHPTGNAAK